MRSLFFALTLCAAALVCGQAAAPDSSTPDKTVQSFWSAWNARDMKTVLSLIADLPADPEREKALATMSQDLFTANVSDVEVVQSGADAVVIYHLVMLPPSKQAAQGATQADLEDMVRLKQTPDGWRILKFKAKPTMQSYGLTAFATYLQSPELIAAGKRTPVDECASNIRQVGLAIIMMSADYDDVIKTAASQGAVHKAVTPYLKSEKLWECPDHPGAPFSFNVKLAGQSMTALQDPSNTVLVYEGAKGELDFRHEGKAWVCFADGHVKAVTKEEAAKLIWTAKKP